MFITTKFFLNLIWVLLRTKYEVIKNPPLYSTVTVSTWPKEKGKIVVLNNINVTKMFPKSLGYFAFNGSLTTPPCSEKVQWVVLKNPISASKKQIESLHTILHDNARDVQPINDRDIESAN